MRVLRGDEMRRCPVLVEERTDDGRMTDGRTAGS